MSSKLEIEYLDYCFTATLEIAESGRTVVVDRQLESEVRSRHSRGSYSIVFSSETISPTRRTRAPISLTGWSGLPNRGPSHRPRLRR